MDTYISPPPHTSSHFPTTRPCPHPQSALGTLSSLEGLGWRRQDCRATSLALESSDRWDNWGGPGGVGPGRPRWSQGWLWNHEHGWEKEGSWEAGVGQTGGRGSFERVDGVPRGWRKPGLGAWVVSGKGSEEWLTPFKKGKRGNQVGAREARVQEGGSPQDTKRGEKLPAGGLGRAEDGITGEETRMEPQVSSREG